MPQILYSILAATCMGVIFWAVFNDPNDDDSGNFGFLGIIIALPIIGLIIAAVIFIIPFILAILGIAVLIALAGAILWLLWKALRSKPARDSYTSIRKKSGELLRATNTKSKELIKDLQMKKEQKKESKMSEKQLTRKETDKKRNWLSGILASKSEKDESRDKTVRKEATNERTDNARGRSQKTFFVFGRGNRNHSDDDKNEAQQKAMKAKEDKYRTSSKNDNQIDKKGVLSRIFKTQSQEKHRSNDEKSYDNNIISSSNSMAWGKTLSHFFKRNTSEEKLSSNTKSIKIAQKKRSETIAKFLSRFGYTQKKISHTKTSSLEITSVRVRSNMQMRIISMNTKRQHN